MHGGLVLADRGFDISEELALHGVTLAVPPFTNKGKPQLSSRTFRIHEIGRLNLQEKTLPITKDHMRGHILQYLCTV